jgi:hypothetical protein
MDYSTAEKAELLRELMAEKEENRNLLRELLTETEKYNKVLLKCKNV